MVREESFDSFYRATRRRVLHQAFALTGDLPAAQSAVRDAYVGAWQHWRKVSRLDDPLDWVRPRAWQLAQRRHTARIWHRNKGVSEEHKAVLDALAKLPVAQRRVLLLTDLAGLDVAPAARELGVTRTRPRSTSGRRRVGTRDGPRRGARDVPGAAGRARRPPGARHPAPWPDRAACRPQAAPGPRAGRRGDRRRGRARRGRLHLPADGQQRRGPAAREARDARRPDGPAARRPPPAATSSTTTRSAGSDPTSRGRSPAPATTPPATASTRSASRAASPTRTATPRSCGASRAAGRPRRSAVQTVEVSKSQKQAETAFDTTVGWYSGCRLGRLQVLNAYRVDNIGDEADVLMLRIWKKPVTTLSVAVARTGKVTTSTVGTTVGAARRPRPRSPSRWRTRSPCCAPAAAPRTAPSGRPTASCPRRRPVRNGASSPSRTCRRSAGSGSRGSARSRRPGA